MKSLVSALAVITAIGLQAATTYMATEQYVQKMVKAESNRTDRAINDLRQEVLDAQYLMPSSVKAGANITVTTNALGEVTIDSDMADYANVSNAAMSAYTVIQFAEWFPDGSVKGAAEFTAGIKYDAPNTTDRTITVKPFCNTGTAADDNSGLVGRVVIPPFVDAQGNPYISDDGTRFKVVGVGDGGMPDAANTNLTAIVVPTTVVRVGMGSFAGCVNLTSAKLPAAPLLEEQVFYNCSRLQKVSLPRCAAIGNNSFGNCYSLTEVSLPMTTELFANVFQQNTSLQKISLPKVTNIADSVFSGCTQLAEVNFGGSLAVVPSLGISSFPSLSGSCRLIVPDVLYDAWSTTTGWGSLTSMGYTYMKYSEWEYSREYEVKAAMQPDTYWDYSDIPEGEILYRGVEFDTTNGVWSIVLRGNAGGVITEHTLKAFGTAADTKVTLTNIMWTVQATLIPYWKFADREDVKIQPSGNYLTVAETEGMLKDIGMRFVYPTFSQNKYSLENFSYNYVSGLLDDESVTFALPSSRTQKGRMLVLVVYCQSAPTGVTLSVEGATTLIYPNGQSTGFWILAAGYNVFRFEEIASGLFLMSKTVGN